MALGRELKRIFKDTSVYGFGALLPKMAALILMPIYAKYLGPEGYGLFAFAAMVAMMLGHIMTLGQNGAVTLFYRGRAQIVEDKGSLLFSVTLTVIGFAALVTGLGFLAGPHIADEFSGSGKVPFYPYLAIALIIALVSVPQTLQQAVNRALGQAKTYIAFQLASWAINTAFTLYFVVALHQGAYGSLKGTLIAGVAILPAVFWVLVRRWKPQFSFSALRTSLRFGLPLVPHYFAGWALTFLDRWLLMRLTPAGEARAAVGLYSAAYSVGMILNYFCTSINLAWTPIYYDLADSEEGRKKLPRLITITLAAITFLAIGVTMLATDLLLVLTSTNRRFVEAAGIVPIITGGYFFFAIYMIISTPVFHHRKTAIVPLMTAAAAGVNILACLLLIPAFGIYGAAIATLIAYACLAAAARLMCWRLRERVFENRNTALLVGLYLLSMALAVSIRQLGLPLWLDIIVRVLLVPVFLGLLIATRVTTVQELTRVLKLRRRRGAKAKSDPRAGSRVAERETGLQAAEAPEDDTDIDR